MPAVENYISGMSVLSTNVLSAFQSNLRTQQDGVVFGYIHPFLRTLRVVIDSDGSDVRTNLEASGYQCVKIALYVPDGKKAGDCDMAYLNKHQAVALVRERLLGFRSHLKELDCMEDRDGQLHFGDGSELAGQHRLQYLLMRCRRDGD